MSTNKEEIKIDKKEREIRYIQSYIKRHPNKTFAQIWHQNHQNIGEFEGEPNFSLKNSYVIRDGNIKELNEYLEQQNARIAREKRYIQQYINEQKQNTPSSTITQIRKKDHQDIMFENKPFSLAHNYNLIDEKNLQFEPEEPFVISQEEREYAEHLFNEFQKNNPGYNENSKKFIKFRRNDHQNVQFNGANFSLKHSFCILSGQLKAMHVNNYLGHGTESKVKQMQNLNGEITVVKIRGSNLRDNELNISNKVGLGTVHRGAYRESNTKKNDRILKTILPEKHYIEENFVKGKNGEKFFRGADNIIPFKTNATIEQKLSIALNIAKAVKSFHDANIIHCDLKPENMRVDDSQNPPKVTLIDIGCAIELAPGQEKSKPKDFVGTLEYSAWSNKFAPWGDTSKILNPLKHLDLKKRFIKQRNNILSQMRKIVNDPNANIIKIKQHASNLPKKNTQLNILIKEYKKKSNGVKRIQANLLGIDPKTGEMLPDEIAKVTNIEYSKKHDIVAMCAIFQSDCNLSPKELPINEQVLNINTQDGMPILDNVPSIDDIVYNIKKQMLQQDNFVNYFIRGEITKKEAFDIALREGISTIVTHLQLDEEFKNNFDFNASTSKLLDEFQAKLEQSNLKEARGIFQNIKTAINFNSVKQLQWQQNLQQQMIDKLQKHFENKINNVKNIKGYNQKMTELKKLKHTLHNDFKLNKDNPVSKKLLQALSKKSRTAVAKKAFKTFDVLRFRKFFKEKNEPNGTNKDVLNINASEKNMRKNDTKIASHALNHVKRTKITITQEQINKAIDNQNKRKRKKPLPHALSSTMDFTIRPKSR